MKQKSIVKWLSSSLLAVSVLGVSSVQAQGAAIQCPGYKKSSTKIPGQRVGKRVQQAFEFYQADQMNEAIEVLKDIDAKDAFDRAYVDKFLGNLLASQEGKGVDALDYMIRAVKEKQLNDNEHADSLRLTADLHMQQKKYADAIGWYEQWMSFTCKEDPDVYTRMAQAFYETKQLPKMIAPADKAIALYDKPNKNPHVLKLTSYFERKMYPETIKVTETLVKLFPETKQWWTQLGFFYMLVEDYPKALRTFELAYEQGYLEKASEITALAQLYNTNEIPYKSAVIQDKYMKSGLLEKSEINYTRLAGAWHRAKHYEKAAAAYGEAAKMSNDAEHYQKQGTLLLNAEKYDAALAALQKALDLGVKRKGDVHMAMMEANFYQRKWRQANVHVQEAKKETSSRRNALAWEPYIKEKAKNNGVSI